MKNMVLQIKGQADGKTFSTEFKENGSHPLFDVKWEENGNDLKIRFLPKAREELSPDTAFHPLVIESVRLSFPLEYL